MEKKLKIIITDISMDYEVNGVTKCDVVASVAIGIKNLCEDLDIPMETFIKALDLVKNLKH